MDNRPLGIFDSGVGGISVLQEILKVLPREDIVYFADSGNCPYGIRPIPEIRELACRITTFLLDQDAKAIVVACNTASTAAVSYLRKMWPQVPIVGMVPAVKPAVSLTRSGVVGVLATEATSKAPALLDVIDRFAANVKVLTAAPPGLVELIEAGQVSSPETVLLLQKYLAPILARGADAIVLGCTHFPFLRPVLREIVGETVQLIDSGSAVAKQTYRILAQYGLLNGDPATGKLSFFTSGEPEQVGQVISRLLESSTSILVQKVNLSNLE